MALSLENRLHRCFCPGCSQLLDLATTELLDLATRLTQLDLRFTHRLITAPNCSTWSRGFSVICAAAIRFAYLLVTLEPPELFLFVLVSFG